MSDGRPIVDVGEDDYKVSVISREVIAISTDRLFVLHMVATSGILALHCGFEQ